MSVDEMKAMIEVFRKLKQWRDEKQVVENEAQLRTGAPSPAQEHVRVH